MTGVDGRSVLYLTYDGLTDPLGRSQVLPYLTGLTAKGHTITILSCEKPERLATDESRIRAICSESGIAWHPLIYHKAPPILSSMYDQWRMRRAAFELQKRNGFDIVHCRSYIPAAIGLAMKEQFGTAFLFDMRGFWPDEKVEAGAWDQEKSLYRAIYSHFKRLEKRLLSGADHIVSLTHEGKRQLLTRPQFQPAGPAIDVIPCCADFDVFPLRSPELRERGRSALSLPEDVDLLGYLGSVGAWYMLDEMLDFFIVYARSKANPRFLFVTREPAEPIRQAAANKGIDPDRLIVRPAAREEVAPFMAAVDLGIFFIKPVFSKKASSPTKMGEMLALGLPLITNDGVGDVGQIVRETGCGVAIDQFNEMAYEEALRQVETMAVDPVESRQKALPWFDVKLGVDSYDRIYRGLEPIIASRNR